ncbi:MAG TPA: dihydrolipoamide acetyltransferase family protein [Thermoleophilaceae bacterium]|nr:dihydrolipoamide acetyltransferase family protein [Thermoleophilaceae bacterium]
MASDVTMPRLSDSMEEGTVLKWLVDEGAEVKRGEPLVEIETDKANMTYDADTDGVLVEIVAQEGDTLPIGEVIARIGDAGEAKSGGGDEEEAGEEANGEGGDEEAATAEEADEHSGGADEAAEEEQESVPATAEGDGDEAEGKGEDEAGGKGEGEEAAAGEGDDDAGASGGEDEGDEQAAEGEEAAVAGAEGGGGETQAGAGTATREKTSTGNGDGRVKASPVARRMARDLGVELAQLEGTGPGGRIVKADVQAAAENGGATATEAPEQGEAEAAEEPAAKAETEEKKEKAEERPAKKEAQRAEAGVKGDVDVEELTRLQQTVSRRMAESKATAPDFSIALTVDMTAAVELRQRLKEISEPVPSFNDMVVKACASALREHPRVNGAYRDGKFELYDRVNVGIAVAAMDALVVPTIFDADKKSLGQIARDAREVIGRVKEKTVTPPELSGGTFTVSNLGMFGIEHFTAIINPPQAAILTVGKLDKQPAVDDKGKVVARDQMVLTLVCDHRILYGADGAQFLARVKDLLEQPLSLAL